MRKITLLKKIVMTVISVSSEMGWFVGHLDLNMNQNVNMVANIMYSDIEFSVSSSVIPKNK